jgi:hypothetical protein
VWCDLVALGTGRLRKLLLVSTGIMFSEHPMFQASVSCAVLFASYALHVQHQPFLPGAVVPLHYLSALKSDPSGEAGAVPAEVQRALKEHPRLGYVFNYNAIEVCIEGYIWGSPSGVFAVLWGCEGCEGCEGCWGCVLHSVRLLCFFTAHLCTLVPLRVVVSGDSLWQR